MIMRKLILSLVALAFCAGAFAQDTWFCGTLGAKLNYTRTGAAQAETYQYVVTGIKQDGDRTTISEPSSCGVMASFFAFCCSQR